MTRAQTLATNLRQLVGVFWILGILATLGFTVAILNDVSSEQPRAAGVYIAWMVSVWIGFAWMGLLANGMAELLAPRETETPTGQVASIR